eukprot:2301245-Pyramimonas_sp.AAC.1
MIWRRCDADAVFSCAKCGIDCRGGWKLRCCMRCLPQRSSFHDAPQSEPRRNGASTLTRPRTSDCSQDTI